MVNLDELAGAKREVTYKGTKHEVLDLALADFITFQKDFDHLLKVQSEGNFEEMVDVAAKITALCVPTFQDLRKLNMRQMMALVQLIADFYPQDSGSEKTEAPVGNDESPDQTT
jgi:hypothetical protein